MPGIHARVRRKRRHAPEARLHLSPAAARQVDAAHVPFEQQVAGEQDPPAGRWKLVEPSVWPGVWSATSSTSRRYASGPSSMRSSAVAGGMSSSRPPLSLRLSGDTLGRVRSSRRYASARWIASRALVSAFTAAFPKMWSGCPWVLRISSSVSLCARSASSAVRSPIDGSTSSASPRSSTMTYMPLSYGGTRHAMIRTFVECERWRRRSRSRPSRLSA